MPSISSLILFLSTLIKLIFLSLKKTMISMCIMKQNKACNAWIEKICHGRHSGGSLFKVFISLRNFIYKYCDKYCEIWILQIKLVKKKTYTSNPFGLSNFYWPLNDKVFVGKWEMQVFYFLSNLRPSNQIKHDPSFHPSSFLLSFF